MSPFSLHYFPLALPFQLALAGLFALTVAVVAVRFVSIASASLGIGMRPFFALMLLSLLGSYLNIPIAMLPAREITTLAEVSYFGMLYVIPVVHDWPATVVAVNFGGAVIPVALSAYLIAKNRLYGASLAGIVVVAAVCHLLARPVPGLGIAIPVFVPPLVTAVAALVLTRRHVAALAYISGSLGTLIGADLLNLDKVQGLGAPIVSIGGAGTFDGVFVTGLIAVLFASLLTDRTARRDSVDAP